MFSAGSSRPSSFFFCLQKQLTGLGMLGVYTVYILYIHKPTYIVISFKKKKKSLVILNISIIQFAMS